MVKDLAWYENNEDRKERRANENYRERQLIRPAGIGRKEERRKGEWEDRGGKDWAREKKKGLRKEKGRKKEGKDWRREIKEGVRERQRGKIEGGRQGKERVREGARRRRE